MQSRNAYILGSFVIPEGATSGIRIVFDAENGVILVYDEFDSLIGWIAPNDGTDAAGTEYYAGVGMHPQESTLMGASRTSITMEAHQGRLRFTRNPNHPGPPAEFVWDGEIRATNPNNLAAGSARLYLTAPSSFPNGNFMQVELRSVSTDGTSQTHMLDIGPEDFSSTAARANATQILSAGFHWRKTYDDGTDEYFREDWTALGFAAGWGNTGAPYNDAEYKLCPDGTVHLRGMIDGPAVADGTLICGLPAAYSSPAVAVFPVATAAPAVHGGITIDSTGSVNVYGGITSVSLEGISYSISA